ncbi:MAG: YihY/virulence factor BrkB family protein [Pseudomonadota bacterium]
MRQGHRGRTEDVGRHGRPIPDEAPEPQPEHDEPRLEDPAPTDLSRRDYLAIAKRAVKESLDDHITNIAAALAYYGFLAIPSTLLVALGVFSLVADPSAVQTLVDKLGTVMPGEAQSLLDDSLTRMTQQSGGAWALVGFGGLAALWSVTGAMQNIMWALNTAYDREETRGFVRRRLLAGVLAGCVFIGFALLLGLLVLGPHLSHWVGDAVGAETVVHWAWLIGQWPILVAGLLLAFAGILYLGPNVEHPRWSFLSIGAVIAVTVWLVGSGAFALYTSQFGSYNKAWGSLSAVVILLTWLWLTSVALLFGAEVNAEAERSRELRRGEPAEVELQAPTQS